MNNYLVRSFLTLRKALGYLGIAFPFILVFGGMLLYKLETQSSISGYYHTGMRDFFVGILCSIGVVLWAYKGYEEKDNISGNIAGSLAICVAIFPTTPVDPSELEKIIGGLHIVFAASFFVSLALISLFLFTKTNENPDDPRSAPTSKKKQRNWVYKGCGYVMLGAMGLLVLFGLLQNSIAAPLQSLDPVFWLESVAIIAFGISWLTKGEGIRALLDETQ